MLGTGASYRARCADTTVHARTESQSTDGGAAAPSCARSTSAAPPPTTCCAPPSTRTRARGVPPAALVLGTCCHHRCAWHAYPNRPYLERQGLCAPSTSRRSAASRQLGCQPAGRGRRGRGGRCGRARRARAQGQGPARRGPRAEYLRAHGHDAALQTYVDSAVTPENVLIVATDRRLEAPLGRLSKSV